MIDGFSFEGQLIGFKEGVKIGLIWLVCYSFLFLKNRQRLIRSFYAGLFISITFSILIFSRSDGLMSIATAGKIISMSFAMFLIISGTTLYHASETDLFLGRFQWQGEILAGILIFLCSVIFFLPDFTGSALYLRELSLLNENITMTWISSATGMIIALIIIIVFVKLYRPYWIGNFFAVPQLFLFLAMVKLFGSGIKGMTELSLIPSVQRGFMKFIHDFVHQTFLILLVPDHPLLKKTTWDFIGIFFGANFASLASLFILLTIPMIFIHHSLFKPLPEPEVSSSVSKRQIKSLILSERRKRALPVLFFSLFIVAAWTAQKGESVSKIYNPEPAPVVAERGIVIIPLKDPSSDVMDGRLHKFSLLHNDNEIRILVIKRQDNTLSVCLDACEICPPDGYGQREDHVVCLYCKTPIPVNTLGEPGGCNPIPLKADIDERFIRIEMQEILKKWEFVKTATDK